MSRPTDDELEAVAVRLDHARLTMTNDDRSRQGTDKRARFINRLDAMTDAAAMLRACKGRVRVKPLVWEYHPAGKIAAPPTGHAYIIDTRMKGRCYSVKGFNPKREFDSLDEAKAAAQADYEARILAALEPAPDHSDWNAALEAAAKVANHYQCSDKIRALKKGPDHET